MKDAKHLKAIQKSADAFVAACQAGLNAGLKLYVDMTFEEGDGIAPRFDIEVTRKIGDLVAGGTEK